MQYTAPGINEPTLGVLSDTAIYRAPKGWPPTSLALLDNWSEFVGQLAVLRAEDLESATNAKLVAPITYPRKLICAGANFYSHAAEMGTPPPDPSAPPFFFLKPTSAYLRNGGTIEVSLTFHFFASCIDNSRGMSGE